MNIEIPENIHDREEADVAFFAMLLALKQQCRAQLLDGKLTEDVFAERLKALAKMREEYWDLQKKLER